MPVNLPDIIYTLACILEDSIPITDTYTLFILQISTQISFPQSSIPSHRNTLLCFVVCWPSPRARKASFLLHNHMWAPSIMTSHTHTHTHTHTRVKVKMLVAQLCLTLCNPMDCSPPGSSILGILQAKILEWVAMTFSRGSSQHRDRTWVSHIAGRFFPV